MKTDIRTIGDIRILDMSGKITLGPETGTLRQNIQDILNCGGKKILLNLGAVHYIDSCGVGELVSAYTKIANIGGHEDVIFPDSKTVNRCLAMILSHITLKG